MSSLFNSVAGLVSRDMAVDLGTANTLIYVRGEGIVLDEPSVVAVNVHDGKALAVGSDAKRMIGRTPNHIQAIRPLKDGVIADFDVCERMLRHFIQKVHPSRFAKPRMVICVPSGITRNEYVYCLVGDRVCERSFRNKIRRAFGLSAKSSHTC